MPFYDFLLEILSDMQLNRMNQHLLTNQIEEFDSAVVLAITVCVFIKNVRAVFWLNMDTFMTVSNIGMRTNLMKPICAVGLVTLSRSIKGATGSPSDFSLSLCINTKQQYKLK